VRRAKEVGRLLVAVEMTAACSNPRRKEIPAATSVLVTLAAVGKVASNYVVETSLALVTTTTTTVTASAVTMETVERLSRRGRRFGIGNDSFPEEWQAYTRR
jgi:hypothetical protein